MSTLVLVIVVYVVGLGTVPVSKRVQNGLLTLSTKAWWLGWIWVVLGPGGLQEFSRRCHRWKIGMEKCSVCQRKVNTNTQNGVTYGADEDGIFILCPKDRKGKLQ